MKKKIALLLISTAFLLTGCTAEVADMDTDVVSEESLEASENEPVDEPISAPTSVPTNTVTPTPAPTSVPRIIDNIDVSFSDNVRNDVTGNWRLSRVATTEFITDYALDYYNTYFSSDDEVHAIINFTTNTTNKISVIGESIDVSVYEYVDGEEHDAKELFGGTLLYEYFINISTGEIEEIQ